MIIKSSSFVQSAPWARTALAVLVGSLVAASPGLAQEPAAKEEPRRTWVGLTAGLPVPVGGALGLQVHRLIGTKDFADIGISSAAILSGVYVTWGHKVGDNGYTLLGADVDVFVFLGNSIREASLAGIHGGYGWEWFLGPTRTTVAVCAGFPWLGGLRLGVAL